jgi:hypothetical protein
MAEVREALDAAKDRATELQKEYDFICAVRLPPMMEAAGITSFKMDSGKGIRVQDEVFVSVKAEDFDAFKNWLIEQGDAGIIKETVHPQTLKAYVTGRIKNGEEYPEQVKISIVPKARFY